MFRQQTRLRLHVEPSKALAFRPVYVANAWRLPTFVSHEGL